MVHLVFRTEASESRGHIREDWQVLTLGLVEFSGKAYGLVTASAEPRRSREHVGSEPYWASALRFGIIVL